MLSIFPSLLSYQQFAPFIIRLTLGVIFVHWAIVSLRKKGGFGTEKAVSLGELIAGILLIVGLYTQVASLFIAIDMIVKLVSEISKKQFLNDGVNYYLILLILAISLMVTGAGILAYDLPL